MRQFWRKICLFWVDLWDRFAPRQVDYQDYPGTDEQNAIYENSRFLDNADPTYWRILPCFAKSYATFRRRRINPRAAWEKRGFRKGYHTCITHVALLIRKDPLRDKTGSRAQEENADKRKTDVENSDGNETPEESDSLGGSHVG